MKARAAVAIVCGVLAAAAIASYAVGDRLSRLVGTVHLPQRLDAAIPSQLAGWNGRDEPMSDADVRMTQVDDYLRRRYASADGDEVLLYVAFHGNKARGQNTYYHNPTVCLPAQGLKLAATRTGTETLPDSARVLPVCRYVFANETARLAVLTFFQVDGDLLGESPRNDAMRALLDQSVPQLDDSPGTFVQVQVIVGVGDSGDAAAADVQSKFLRAFGSTILRAVDPSAAR